MTIEATVDGTVIRWRDKKRYLWIIGAIVPLIPVSMWGLYVLTDSTLAWYFGPFFVFVIIPIIDLIVGRDGENPPGRAPSRPSRTTVTTVGSPTPSSPCRSSA
ncbi:hypothetical protein [Aeromicrobium sp. UC242_57]|uniref:hypothetical protein n=1 Tax=Aeromicrobium sp. UC242_57 TaxID=3374624 RepID=UPI00378864FE